MYKLSVYSFLSDQCPHCRTEGYDGLCSPVSAICLVLIIKPNYWAKKDIISLFGNYFKPSAVKGLKLIYFPESICVRCLFKSSQTKWPGMFQPLCRSFSSSGGPLKIIAHVPLHTSKTPFGDRSRVVGKEVEPLGALTKAARAEFFSSSQRWRWGTVLWAERALGPVEGLAVFASGVGVRRRLCHTDTCSFRGLTSSRKLLLPVIILG